LLGQVGRRFRSRQAEIDRDRSPREQKNEQPTPPSPAPAARCGLDAERARDVVGRRRSVHVRTAIRNGLRLRVDAGRGTGGAHRRAPAFRMPAPARLIAAIGVSTLPMRNASYTLNLLRL